MSIEYFDNFRWGPLSDLGWLELIVVSWSNWLHRPILARHQTGSQWDIISPLWTVMRSHCVSFLQSWKRFLHLWCRCLSSVKIPPRVLFTFNPIKKCYFHKNKIINFCHREANRSNPCGHIWVKDNFSKYFVEILKNVSRNFIILYFQQNTGRHRIRKRKSKPPVSSVSWLSDSPSLEEVHHDQVQPGPELLGGRDLQGGSPARGEHSDRCRLFLQLAEGGWWLLDFKAGMKF